MGRKKMRRSKKEQFDRRIAPFFSKEDMLKFEFHHSPNTQALGTE